jgi:hypothetical protein
MRGTKEFRRSFGNSNFDAFSGHSDVLQLPLASAKDGSKFDKPGGASHSVLFVLHSAINSRPFHSADSGPILGLFLNL